MREPFALFHKVFHANPKEIISEYFNLQPNFGQKKKKISLHLQVFQRRIRAALNLEDEVSTKCLNDPRVV